MKMILRTLVKNSILIASISSLAFASFFPFTVYAGFEGEVIVKWCHEECHGEDQDGYRKMELMESFSYTGPNKKKWIVPRGAIVDGASIPRVLWSIVGSPYTGNYRDASVIHDYYCDTKTESWEDTHRMFYDAMLDSKVSIARAKLMYGAVYAAGPRWEKITTKGLEGTEILIVEQPSPGITKNRLVGLEEALIKNDKLSLEEIERFVEQN